MNFEFDSVSLRTRSTIVFAPSSMLKVAASVPMSVLTQPGCAELTRIPSARKLPQDEW